MLSIKRMTPFYMSKEEFRLRLVFAYQYFSIVKGDEVFQFVPSEGKEIIINTKSMQVENLGEVFVFQKGNRFIRLPLYQLLLISDLPMHLKMILGETFESSEQGNQPEKTETEKLIDHLEMRNRMSLIDYALDTNDECLFYQLAEGMHGN